MNFRPSNKPDSDVCSDVACFSSRKSLLSGLQLVCRGGHSLWACHLDPESLPWSLAAQAGEQCLPGAFPERLKGVLLGCRRDT